MKYVATVKAFYLIACDFFKVFFDAERGALVADCGEEYFIPELRFDDLETGIAHDATDAQLAEIVHRLYPHEDNDEFQLVDCIG